MKKQDELHKPYLDVPPLDHFWYCVDYKDIWKKYAPVEQIKPIHIKHRKDPKWFVVHEGFEGDYVVSFHTKKEALADMKGSGWEHCYLIKGKIVK